MKLGIGLSVTLLLMSVNAFAYDASLSDICKATEDTRSALAGYHDTVQMEKKPKYEDIIIELQVLSGTVESAFGSLNVSENVPLGKEEAKALSIEVSRIKATGSAIRKIIQANRASRHALIAHTLEGELAAIQTSTLVLKALACQGA